MNNIYTDFSPCWSEEPKVFRHTWEGLVNIDQFRWMVRRDVQEQLKLAHDEIGARHVRAVGMFCDEMRFYRPGPESFVGQKSPRINLQLIDYVIDSLQDIGMSPMFTTCFTPTLLASGEETVFTTKSNVSFPKDLTLWTELVQISVRHMIDRYGKEMVRRWYFEVWNEPNLRPFFAAEQKDFFRLWQTTFEAIKSVDPELRVGGPSSARAEWIGDLVEFGNKNHCVPDYITTHIYNNDSDGKPLSPFDGPQEHRQNQSPHFAAGVMRGTRRLLDELSFRGEVHWNEWGRSWHPYHPQRETVNEAAYICKTMSEVSHLADYYAYWCLSDVYDQAGYGAETFHGNYGMMNLNGLRKPSYHAHQLLSMLGQHRVPIGFSGDELCGAIATQDEKYLSVLVWAYQQDEHRTSTHQHIRIEFPHQIRHEKAKLYRLGHQENNILHSWRHLGAPAYLNRNQLHLLREVNTLQTADNAAMEWNDVRELRAVTFAMDMPGVALIQVPRNLD